jgi:hypothetical protein
MLRLLLGARQDVPPETRNWFCCLRSLLDLDRSFQAIDDEKVGSYSRTTAKNLFAVPSDCKSSDGDSQIERYHQLLGCFVVNAP